MNVKADRINLHEDWQGLPYLEFLGVFYFKSLGKPIPPIPAKLGKSLKAHINHGRWLVDCPNCNSAVLVSFAKAVFICPECGSPDNKGSWYKVLFPADKGEIETELLKRPKIANRNLGLVESLEDIKTENTKQGIK